MFKVIINFIKIRMSLKVIVYNLFKYIFRQTIIYVTYFIKENNFIFHVQ